MNNCSLHSFSESYIQYVIETTINRKRYLMITNIRICEQESCIQVIRQRISQRLYISWTTLGARRTQEVIHLSLSQIVPPTQIALTIIIVQSKVFTTAYSALVLLRSTEICSTVC